LTQAGDAQQTHLTGEPWAMVGSPVERRELRRDASQRLAVGSLTRCDRAGFSATADREIYHDSQPVRHVCIK
jgi:hypothetical protein